MITLEHASRWYGHVLGVNDVSCTISSGITTLLGPNGAGKTTLIRLITGQLRPTTGSVSVLGERPFANPRVYARLGYCPEGDGIYEDLTGRDMVTFLAALSGLSGRRLRERVQQALEVTGIHEHADRRIAGYSKGMRQRVKLAQALVHDPEILILDEPLNGLDPVGRREMAQLMKDLGAAGKCVVVSSHILHEVEQLTRNILVLHHGRLLAQGDLYAIRALIDAHPHRIAISTPDGRELARCLLNLPGVVSARLKNGHAAEVEIETTDPERFYQEFPHLVADHGFRVWAFSSPDNNLEAVFRYLVEGSA
ncbi:MAG: ABC transporter ATP-binding protein [Chthonomonadales bacterium]